MLFLKRRLSSLSLRHKTPDSFEHSQAPDSNGKEGFIKAGLPGSQQPLAQSSGTITPLINGIRDIIEDVLPMPSARHVPPDLQRRLSTLPSAQTSQSQQASALWDSRRTEVEDGTGLADVLVIEDGSIVTAEEAVIARQRRSAASDLLQDDGAQQVLPSESSLVWDLPQLPSISSSRPHTQGMHMQCSSAVSAGYPFLSQGTMWGSMPLHVYAAMVVRP